MSIEPEDCSREPRDHAAVLTAFQAVLPDGDALKSIARHIDSNHDPLLWQQAAVAYEEYGPAAVAALGEHAAERLCDFLVHPAEHHVKTKDDATGHELNKIATALAAVYCKRHPSQRSADALMNRLRTLFADPIGAGEIEESFYIRREDYLSRYYFPKAQHCLQILFKHRDCAGVDEFLNAIYRGEHNVRIDHGEEAYSRFEDACAFFLSNEGDLFDEFAESLMDRGELTFEWYENAVQLFSSYLRADHVFPEGKYVPEPVGSPAYRAVHREYVKRVLRNQLDQLPESADHLNDILYVQFQGLEWLDRGLQCIETQGLKAKDLASRYDKPATIARKLVSLRSLQEGETEADLIDKLSKFKARTLQLALPYAGCARVAILKALGWDGLIPLQKQLFRIVESHPGSIEPLQDIENGTDPTSGVIDRQAVSQALHGIEDKPFTQYTKALRASSLELKNALLLVRAVQGADREALEKKLVRHAQTAIKAFGLYPLIHESDLRERYLKFKAMHKEATKYGPERQANTQAAVLAGLKNLAQTAGYPDETRLEWAMEADIATDRVPFDEAFAVETWQVQLVLDGITPRIRVNRNGKALKSVPAKVRKAEIYQKMRDAQDTIRGQASRFRKALEDMMCHHEPIPAKELAALSRLPVVNAMLRQLILLNEEGQFGRFQGRDRPLAGLRDEPVAIDGALTIAHAYHLFEAGVLPDWQRAIVRNRVVQPFKQAFRELYVLTPAEEESGTHSRRFAGHVIDAAKASRLLQSRGWTQTSGDIAEVYKRFPRHPIHAEIGFPGAGHYLAENDTVTIDEIWFWNDQGEVRMSDVEPLVFSEVMRDADLLASVAHVDDEDRRWSTESMERRVELVTALFAEIGLSRVRTETHFAYIEGQRANYRIHLGSGAIHIQPGNYLCVVPAREPKEAPVFLPFADTDRRMAEIVSKIFLLASDESIEDPSILAQIERAVS